MHVVDAAHQHRRVQFVRAGEAERGDHLLRLRDRRRLVLRRRGSVLSATTSARGPLRVLRGDADRALVRVAALRLDAADRLHHRARGVRVVGTLDQPLDDVDAGGHLAARADLDPVAQARPDQRVVQRHQPVGERRADVVLVLQRRRAGAALGAVDDDEVRA